LIDGDKLTAQSGQVPISSYWLLLKFFATAKTRKLCPRVFKMAPMPSFFTPFGAEWQVTVDSDVVLTI